MNSNPIVEMPQRNEFKLFIIIEQRMLFVRKGPILYAFHRSKCHKSNLHKRETAMLFSKTTNFC